MFKAISKKGASSVSSVVGLIVGIILVVGVSIPITQSVITTANLTGLTATIVGFIPVFLAIAGLVLATKMMKG